MGKNILPDKNLDEIVGEYNEKIKKMRDDKEAEIMQV